MKKITFSNEFVNTTNVRNLKSVMEGSALAQGEGHLVMVSGRAGRGKTRACLQWSVHNSATFLRIMTVWRKNDLEFLKALCRELGVNSPPHRRGPCFNEAVDILVARPRVVFLDEAEKMAPSFLDIVRDISDMSGCAFVLIGEEELVDYMRRNRRVWSRTFQQMEFEPLSPSDFTLFADRTTGLQLSIPVTGIFHANSGGDIRLAKRDLLALVQYCNAMSTREVTEEMAKTVIKIGLSGK